MRFDAPAAPASTPPDAGAPTAPQILSALLNPTAPRQDVLAALRPTVLAHLREAHSALYETAQPLPAAALHGLAGLAAQWQGSAPLLEHHTEAGADPALLTQDTPDDPMLAALRDLADILAVSPSLADPADLRAALDHGAEPAMIVLLGQLIGFESTLQRILLLLCALHEVPVPVADAPQRSTRARGRSSRHGGVGASGRPRPERFTRDMLEWDPWIAVPSAEELTEEQRASFAAKAAPGSVYFRMLALTPQVTAARSALDNAVFVPRDGLPKAERELAAATASRVNDCIYCASVHARKSAALSRAPQQVDALLAAPLERDADGIAADLTPLRVGQDARWGAQITAAAELSRPRSSLRAEHLSDLREHGLDAAQIADLLTAAAFFAWANRLMLGLGDAAVPPAQH